MDHRSPKTFSGIVYQWHNIMVDNKWVNSEKEACSATFSYWSATGKSTGWNWPPGWKRSHEAKRHLITSFLGLFYPTLRTKLKSETVILGGVPCSQSVRHKQRRSGSLSKEEQSTQCCLESKHLPLLQHTSSLIKALFRVHWFAHVGQVFQLQSHWTLKLWLKKAREVETCKQFRKETF